MFFAKIEVPTVSGHVPASRFGVLFWLTFLEGPEAVFNQKPYVFRGGGGQGGPFWELVFGSLFGPLFGSFSGLAAFDNQKFDFYENRDFCVSPR